MQPPSSIERNDAKPGICVALSEFDRSRTAEDQIQAGGRIHWHRQRPHAQGQLGRCRAEKSSAEESVQHLKELSWHWSLRT